MGSNASAAIERAKVQRILFDSNGGYAFYFPTITGFDKAVCGLSVDNDGKVVSKRWEMEYD